MEKYKEFILVGYICLVVGLFTYCFLEITSNIKHQTETLKMIDQKLWDIRTITSEQRDTTNLIYDNQIK